MKKQLLTLILIATPILSCSKKLDPALEYIKIEGAPVALAIIYDTHPHDEKTQAFVDKLRKEMSIDKPVHISTSFIALIFFSNPIEQRKNFKPETIEFMGLFKQGVLRVRAKETSQKILK